MGLETIGLDWEIIIPNQVIGISKYVEIQFLDKVNLDLI